MTIATTIVILSSAGGTEKSLIMGLTGEIMTNKLTFDPGTHVYWSCPIVIKNEFYAYGGKFNMTQIAKERLLSFYDH